MPLEVLPFQPPDMEFLGGHASQKPPDFVAYPQCRKDRQGRIDPGARDAGQFVETEDEGGRNGHWGVDAEEGGEADEDADGETDGDMTRVAVQREYMPDPLPPLFSVEHLDLLTRCEV